MFDFRFPEHRISLALVGLCLVLLQFGAALAQDTAAADTLATHTSSTVPLPVLGYTPDTGLMLGGTLLRFFYLEPEYPQARPSVFSPVFIYTLKSQIMIYLGTDLNWDQNRNSLNLVPYYIKFPDQFYGIGRDVTLDDGEDYTSKRFGLDLDFNRRVWRDWRLGLSYRIQKYRLTEVDPDGQLTGDTITGTEDSWQTGVGPALILDSRDNIWAPDSGWYLQTSARFGGSSLGGDYTNQEYTLDLRGYRKIGQDLVLAGQFLTTRFDGDTPFFIMPLLGGDEGLRGYRAGLYRDTTRALGRLELRRSRLWGRLGIVAFAGIGDVAPSPTKLTLAGELWSAGGGFRFLLDEQERVNLRLDFGFGNGDSGFYLSLGEAF